jgi:ABC-type glycerol-3-phosphate transport system substrate-binding protein
MDLSIVILWSFMIHSGMGMKMGSFFRAGFLLVGLLVLMACQPTETVIPQSTSSKTIAPTPTLGDTATPQPLATSTRIIDLEAAQAKIPPTSVTPPLQPSGTAEGAFTAPRATSIAPTEVAAPTATQPEASEQNYPGPNSAANPANYPGNPTYPGSYPGVTGGEANYPYPGESAGIFEAANQQNPTIPAPSPTATPASPTPTRQEQIPTSTPTPMLTPAAESLPKPLVIPTEGSRTQVEVWHALKGRQLEVIEAVVHSFTQSNPQVSVVLTYIPPDDLRATFESAVYQGRGPDLLIGSSDWVAWLSNRSLVADFSAYFPPELWKAFTPPALAAGRYQGKQVGMPFSMSGIVLYRNRNLVPAPSLNLAQMARSAQAATRGGVIGAYFDLGAFNSMAFYDAQGGQWLDQGGKPVFNQGGYEKGLDWLSLLSEMDRIGVVEVNTSRDSILFGQAKTGIILDGTWNLQSFSQALGAENLAIDPWPTYENRKLAGYIQTQNIYLNAAAAGSPSARLSAALQFAGAMLSQPAQRLLAEGGTVPARNDFQAQNFLMRQAVAALQEGVPFPAALQADARPIYWMALEEAIRRGLGLGTTRLAPLEALTAAYRQIVQELSRLEK